MDENKIVPSKIHLTNIKWEKENTILFKSKLEKNPSYDIIVSHNMMHNLEKEVVKIRLFLDVNVVIDAPIEQGGSYEVDFFYKIDDLSDHYQISNDKPLFSGIFVSTLLGIAYSTLRGMLFNTWKDTFLSNVILPVIAIPDLLKSKR
ncbi:hypothetical protein [Flavobacterium sp. KACC 22761]|uniref:hypothetical protein n=1 Tax=Flavobacterium sp. KACC 22761 TaxID=3092665 RepID=UPI002A7657FF|nr:hypothetical protein [Flavobacterium sp. KACC 22761]WPO77787.1 hypothetical protein SCB73_16070 [Flavobacterium sp. KACC 22761]